MDDLALLDDALAQMRRVIAGIRPDQAHASTPCVGWDVEVLVQHVVSQDLRNFAVVARGDTANWQAPAAELGADWVGAFDEGAKLVVDTWRAQDLERLVPIPGGESVPLSSRADQQIAELAVHSWDLAVATGHDVSLLDAALAEHSLSWSRQRLRPEHRGVDKPFGVEVRVPDAAPIYDRLAGWFGRDPRWKPDRG